MQQIIQINSLSFSIQEYAAIQEFQEYSDVVGIKLTVNDVKDVVLRLSTQQARALACDLIQQAHRAETIKGLKKAKNLPSQSMTPRGML